MLPQWIKETHLYSRLRDWRCLSRQSARRHFYRNFIEPKDLVFDIGANIGHYALIFESLGANVIAIEPQEKLVEGLQKRFRKNRNISVVHCGVGSSTGSATLYKTSKLTEVASLREDIGETSRFAEEHSFNETEKVPMQTFSALVDRYGRPDFCKIDVEGFEHQVLSTLTEPIPILSFEFNREYFDVAKECIHTLSGLTPYQFNYTLGEATSLAQAEWVNGEDLLEILRKSPDPLLWGDIYSRVTSAP